MTKKTIEERISALENITPNESKLMQKVAAQREAIKDIENVSANKTKTIKRLEEEVAELKEQLKRRVNTNDLAVEAEQRSDNYRQQIGAIKRLADKALGL